MYKVKAIKVVYALQSVPIIKCVKESEEILLFNRINGSFKKNNQRDVLSV